jgi:hypothetical protein
MKVELTSVNGNTEQIVNGSHCLGYIHGVMDVTSMTLIACYSKEVTVGQPVQVLIAYARANPQFLHSCAMRFPVQIDRAS